MSVQEAQRFDAVWKQKKYHGFSSGTQGQSTTVFLEALMKRLKPYEYRLPHVIEGGAGAGDHTITLARHGCRVTAVEYSETAVQEIKFRKAWQPCSYRDRIEIVQNDLTTYLKNGANSAVAFYANSVLHFFSAVEREEIYREVRNLQPKRGLLAVSFKAKGDALERRGEVVEENEAGIIVRNNDDGIQRLFVRNPNAIVKELNKAGYCVSNDSLYFYDVKGYNYEGELGKFVGFIGVRE